MKPILIVDADRTSGWMLGCVLREAGYRTRNAGSRIEALLVLHQDPSPPF